MPASSGFTRAQPSWPVGGSGSLTLTSRSGRERSRQQPAPRAHRARADIGARSESSARRSWRLPPRYGMSGNEFHIWTAPASRSSPSGAERSLDRPSAHRRLREADLGHRPWTSPTPRSASGGASRAGTAPRRAPPRPGCPPRAAAAGRSRSPRRRTSARRSTPSCSAYRFSHAARASPDQRRLRHEPGVAPVALLQLGADQHVEQRRQRPDERLGRRRDQDRAVAGGPMLADAPDRRAGDAFCSMNSPTWSPTKASTPATLAPSYRRKNVRRKSPRSRRSICR